MSTKDVMNKLKLDKTYKRIAKYVYMGSEYRVFSNEEDVILTREDSDGTIIKIDI